MLGVGRVAGSCLTSLPFYHFPPLLHVKPETTLCPFPPPPPFFFSFFLPLCSIQKILPIRSVPGSGPWHSGCLSGNAAGTAFANCAAKGLLDKQILRRSGGRERNLVCWRGAGCRDLEIGCVGLDYDDGASGCEWEQRRVTGVMAGGLCGLLEVWMLQGKGRKSIWGRGGAWDRHEQGLPGAETPLGLREGWGHGGAGSVPHIALLPAMLLLYLFSASRKGEGNISAVIKRRKGVVGGLIPCLWVHGF